LSGTSEQALAFPYAKSISAVESAAPSHASIEAADRFGYAWQTYKDVELVHPLSIYPTAVLWLLAERDVLVRYGNRPIGTN
jgi:hypothetical protein